METNRRFMNMAFARTARLGATAVGARIVSLTIVGAMWAVTALAQDASYPSKPIRMIIPFATAGMNDVLGRLLAVKLSSDFNQPVIVENKTGAGGNIGVAYVAKSDPDGYVIGTGSAGTLAINPSLYSSMPFDVLQDIAPISLIGDFPSVLLVNKSMGVTTFKDFLVKLKANPSKFSYGSPGVGTTGHIGMELLKTMVGVPGLVHAPYRGAGDAETAVLSGQVQMLMDPAITGMNFVNDGRLLGIAVASKERMHLAQNLPAIAEYYPGFSLPAWTGIIAPAKTPPAIQNKLSQEIRKIVNSPEVKEQFYKMAGEPKSSTPQEFRTLIAEEVARWAPIIKASGAKAD